MSPRQIGAGSDLRKDEKEGREGFVSRFIQYATRLMFIPPMQPIKLQLYTKPDCPLCDKAKTALEKVSEKYPIQVEEVDITKNLGLFTKYKDLIPVLEMERKRLFVHRIDGSALKRKLMWKGLRQRFIK